MSEGSQSKSAKKRQKKRLNKEKLKQDDGVKSDDQDFPLEDPFTVLKQKLAKAKESGDHKLAAQLRQDIWVLQDVNAGIIPCLDNKDLDQSMKRLEKGSAPVINTEKSQDTSSEGPFDKDLKKLKKKLQQIEILKQKLKNGEKLESSQILKIEKEQTILDEVNEFETLIKEMELTR